MTVLSVRCSPVPSYVGTNPLVMNTCIVVDYLQYIEYNADWSFRGEVLVLGIKSEDFLSQWSTSLGSDDSSNPIYLYL